MDHVTNILISSRSHAPWCKRAWAASFSVTTARRRPSVGMLQISSDGTDTRFDFPRSPSKELWGLHCEAAKLTVPMILFFLPALFVVILGLAAIRAMARQERRGGPARGGARPPRPSRA